MIIKLKLSIDFLVSNKKNEDLDSFFHKSPVENRKQENINGPQASESPKSKKPVDCSFKRHQFAPLCEAKIKVTFIFFFIIINNMFSKNNQNKKTAFLVTYIFIIYLLLFL